MTSVKILLAAVMASAVAAPAVAANFIVNAVIDSGSLMVGALNQVDIDPIFIGVGDTLQLNLTFSDSPLIFGSGGALWTGLLAEPGVNDSLVTTSTLSFVGGSANLLPTTASLTQDNQFSHFGNYFENGTYQTGSESFSLTGVNQSMTLDSSESERPRLYDRAFFYFETSVTPGGIPEPASWAMLIGGFGLVGAMARRRRLALQA